MMKSVIRSFIAIALSSEIQAKLTKISTELQTQLKDIPIRWVPVENIHLTLKFLGDVSTANLEMLKTTLQAEVAGHNPFEISVGELGAFPNIRRPRVIWVNVQAPAELSAVQHGIETSMARLGYPLEERPFHPHLTLSRVARAASPQDLQNIFSVFSKYKVGFLGATRVLTINLYKSDLHPGGASYTCLYRAALTIPA
ncbi:MAG: RNA 2',3'-cyclic phosphodiesterase [Anaerolineales bacterium]|nr:RNA 2',3'-cyclic phosphodiesterase [Anaerolineales bacterium]